MQLISKIPAKERCVVAEKIKFISTVDGLPVRPSGPWIGRKHFYLKRYADIFTRGMHRKWPLTFIDLFAGPGRCVLKDGSETEGSPLISLNFDFDRYIFIEKNSGDFDALRKRCSNSPKASSIGFVPGDCNEVVGDLDPQGLSLAFVDPTGIDVHFDTIRKLTASRRVDLLMNIQLGMDIKRNFRHYLRKKDGSDLDLFLGGNVPWEDVNEPLDAIRLYQDRIKRLNYSTVEYHIEVRNTREVPMYFLFFASRHTRGLDFWKKVTAKDEQGQYEFPLES